MYGLVKTTFVKRSQPNLHILRHKNRLLTNVNKPSEFSASNSIVIVRKGNIILCIHDHELFNYQNSSG